MSGLIILFAVFTAIADVMIASSWARTGSDVKRGEVGSIHTDRPSDPRRPIDFRGTQQAESRPRVP